MNIEKCECDRLGYEYKGLLEQVVSVLHHMPYAKDYISEEGVDKLYNLVIKLATGDCEIIEFKRKLCRYDVTEKIDEQDKQITQLTNNWNELEELIINEINDAQNELNVILQGDDLDYKNECTKEFNCIRNALEILLDKMNEIKEKNNEK